MMLATAHFAMEDPEVGLESRTTLDEGEDGIPFAENKMCIRDRHHTGLGSLQKPEAV